MGGSLIVILYEIKEERRKPKKQRYARGSRIYKRGKWIISKIKIIYLSDNRNFKEDRFNP